ncbi:MAG TPA: T9SS type A sorting domain-containing protein, partial [Saprospiraceae bacterium]|nr:T9SS type A sorting domain-containing protein [Saprospiraceae bacterium]
FMNFLPIKSYSQVDTFVCDNGGFEQDFLYYTGYATIYGNSGTFCPANTNSGPAYWTQVSLPSFRRLEIVNSGVDPLVGIQKTKFGNKALQINSKYGQITNCDHNADVNRIEKKFMVTSQNRIFSIWYAAVFENPQSHQQFNPFFSIQCDLAPDFDLCFDSRALQCENYYSDPLCPFQPIDVVDWTCHTIEIPANLIGQIATLDITVGDCGYTDHFGYAYIDGICEECSSTKLGSANFYKDPFVATTGLGIKNYSCNGDSIVICGLYTLPSLCGTWKLDSVAIPGFTIYNFKIDSLKHSFCFTLPLSNFSEMNCRDLYAELFYGSITGRLPKIKTNTINLCPSDYKYYNANNSVGICQNNNTNLQISDDYYYVNVSVSANDGDGWVIERQLDNPYPNESGHYIMKTGINSGSYDIGPILIQEGSWTLTVNINGCIFTQTIIPPSYCSGCAKYQNLKISPIFCENKGTAVSGDDEWSFNLFIPGSPTASFQLRPKGGTWSNYSFGTMINVQCSLIMQGCKEFELRDPVILSCFSKFTVCPPKPCSVPPNECNLEVYIKQILCNSENSSFSVDLTTSGAAYKCYETVPANPPGLPTSYTSGILPPYPIGPYSEDIYITIYSCNNPSCPCPFSNCYKTIFVPKPDCPNLTYRSKIKQNEEEIGNTLFVVPNPFSSNEIIIHSTMLDSKFEFYNSSGVLLYKGEFKGVKYKFNIDIPFGLYFMRYKNGEGIAKILKVVKY